MSESVTQVWERLQTVLGGEPLSDSERDLWLDLVQQYIDGQSRWETLVNTIGGARTLYGRSQPARKSIGPMQSASNIREATRTQMLTEIVAAHAAQDPEVTSFREEVLGGILLKWSDLQEWITQKQEKERERPVIFLDAVPLPPSHDIRVEAHGIVPDPPITVGEEHPAGSRRIALLDYGIPDKDWVLRASVPHGGVLARLHHLSTTLAQRYRWQPAHATIFVLTGLMPVLQAIDVTWNLSFLQTNAGSVTALSRIVLTIDPTLPPQELRASFQALRQRILGAKWRDLKESQLELARFALHRSDGEPWPQRMATWNTEFPQWRYANHGNFKRDCQNAIEKLLAPIPMPTNFFPQREENYAETPRQS